MMHDSNNYQAPPEATFNTPPTETTFNAPVEEETINTPFKPINIDTSKTTPKKHKEITNKFITLVDELYTSPQLDITIISKELHISTRKLQTIISSTLNASPSKYIRNFRVKKSCELLADPSINMMSIAFKVGFSSFGIFARSFKSLHGITPKQYRSTALVQAANNKNQHTPYKSLENTRILLIFDHDNYQENSLTSTLRKYSKYISISKNPVFTKYLKNTIPNIIICHISKDTYKILQLLQYIRNNENTFKIPFVILTDIDNKQFQIDCYKSIIDDYIILPIDESELLSRLNCVLSIRNQRPTYTNNKANMHLLEPKHIAFLQNFNMCLEEMYSNSEITINDIAERMCMTTRYFQMEIRKLLGKTPFSILREYRLRQAKQLLLNESLSIEIISSSTGFRNPEYFTRTFKEYFGLPPHKFRKQNSKPKA